MKKIKNFLIDRYHLLFKGAAENHLRIQNALQNPDGSYQVTLKFDSYTDLKKYQKKLRRVTVSLSGAVAMVIVAFMVAPYVMNPSRSSAANFQWIQSNWSGAEGTTPAPKNNPTGYMSKSLGLAVAVDSVKMATPIPAVVGNGGTLPAYSSVTDTTNTYLGAGGVIALRSLLNGSCTQTPNCKDIVNQQCKNGFCKLNNGQSCGGVNANCATGYCSTTCQAAPVGTACSGTGANTNCVSGYCNGTTCALSPSDSGYVCTNGTTCASGICTQGICSNWYYASNAGVFVYKTQPQTVENCTALGGYRANQGTIIEIFNTCDIPLPSWTDFLYSGVNKACHYQTSARCGAYILADCGYAYADIMCVKEF